MCIFLNSQKSISFVRKKLTKYSLYDKTRLLSFTKKYIIRSQILLKFILEKYICFTFWNKSTSHVQTWISLRYNDHSRRNTRKDWVYLEVKSKRTGSIERHCFCHNCLLHVLLIQITLSIIHFDGIIHHKIYQIRKMK